MYVESASIIGIADDVIAYGVGSYIMNILSSWGNAINQSLNAIPAYASCGL